MHFSLLFILIMLLIVGPEILHIAFAGVVKVVLWVLHFYALLGFAFLFCFIASWTWHLMTGNLEPALAHRIADPVLAVFIIVGPILFWFEANEGFACTRAVVGRFASLKSNALEK